MEFLTLAPGSDRIPVELFHMSLSKLQQLVMDREAWIAAVHGVTNRGTQEYGSGLPFPSPADLPDPETEPTSPALASGFFTAEPRGKPSYVCIYTP